MKEIPVRIIVEHPTEHENRLKNIMKSNGYVFLSRYVREVNGGRNGKCNKLFMQFKYRNNDDD